MPMKTVSIIRFMLFLLLFSSCIKDKEPDGEMENYIETGDRLPEFTVKNTAGEELRSENFEGSMTLLVFFASTCPDCQRDLPIIEEVWKRMKGMPGFKLAAISRKEDTSTVSRYWEKNGFTMPFYLDPEGEAFALFANSTIPRIYLTDKQNTITWMAIEKIPLTAVQLEEKINALLP